MPVASAAMRLSRMAVMARPCLESMRLVATTMVIMATMKATRKVESRGVPFRPAAPPVKFRLMMTERMISPKASVTMAR